MTSSSLNVIIVKRFKFPWLNEFTLTHVFRVKCRRVSNSTPLTLNWRGDRQACANRLYITVVFLLLSCSFFSRFLTTAYFKTQPRHDLTVFLQSPSLSGVFHPSPCSSKLVCTNWGWKKADGFITSSPVIIGVLPYPPQICIILSVKAKMRWCVYIRIIAMKNHINHKGNCCLRQKWGNCHSTITRYILGLIIICILILFEI